MEFKGTKGGWKAVNRGNHWNNKKIDNIQIQYGNDEECISDHVYCKYDALLISKAPEMLEMLHKIENILTYDTIEPNSPLQEEIYNLIKQSTEL